MNRKVYQILAVATTAAVLFTFTGCNNSTDISTETEATTEINTKASNKYTEAIKFVKDKIDAIPDIDYKLSEEDRNLLFIELMSKAQSGQMNDDDLYYGLRHILCSIGSSSIYLGFNDINPYKKDFLAVSFGWMEEGMIIDNTDDTNLPYLGYHVNSINGYSADAFIEAYGDIMSSETKAGRQEIVNEYDICKSDLVYLGISKEGDETVSINVSDTNGNEKDIDVKFRNSDGTGSNTFYELPYLLPEGVEIPMRQMTSAISKSPCYSFTGDRENGIMYARYMYGTSMPDYTVANYFTEMMEMMQADKAYKAFVFDLSEYDGGEDGILDSILDENSSYLNTKKVALIISGQTAAEGLNIIEAFLKYIDDVTIYGTTTRYAVHTYEANDEWIKIPGTGLGIVLPLKVRELPKLTERCTDIREGVKPDVEVQQSYKDYIKGIDDVYEKIVNTIYR